MSERTWQLSGTIRQIVLSAEELRWAKHLAEEGGWHLACFLAQQVTEKAIKAFLYAQGEEVVLGHSVARLCADAARYQPEFAEKAQRWSLPIAMALEEAANQGLCGVTLFVDSGVYNEPLDITRDTELVATQGELPIITAPIYYPQVGFVP